MIVRKYPLIKEMLMEQQSVFILGPRATGKTHYLKKLLSEFPLIRSIDLLNSADFELYLSSPEWIYNEINSVLDKHVNSKSLPLYFLINEIQGESELRNVAGFHRFLETELAKQIAIDQLPLKLYNYVDTNNNEIDVLMQRNSTSPPIAIEIKSGTNPKQEDLHTVKAFLEEQGPIAKAFALCRTSFIVCVSYGF